MVEAWSAAKSVNFQVYLLQFGIILTVLLTSYPLLKWSVNVASQWTLMSRTPYFCMPMMVGFCGLWHVEVGFKLMILIIKIVVLNLFLHLPKL